MGGVAVTEFAPYNFWQRRKREVGQDIDARKLQDRRSGNRNFGRYKYRPLISLLGNTDIEFEYVTAVNPYFSRHYKYQKGKSDWLFWNVR